MILQILKNIKTNEFFTKWSDCWSCAHEHTFSPIIDTIFITDFKISGKNYNQRKANARNLAIDLQNTYIYYDIYTSYYDTMQLSNIFEKIGKRYGLLTEYKENGIC